MKRKLIVNADDFGLTPGVNSAISECAELGVLRSATIMPNAPAFEDAVRTAKSRGNLGVGIHFVLTRLKPLNQAVRIPELTNGCGSLPAGPFELLKTVMTRRGAREEIRRELTAQAERVFDSGITPTHFDSHKHVHIIPAVLDVMVEIARRYSVGWIRNPFEGPGAGRFLFDVEKDKRGTFLRQYAAALCAGSARLLFEVRTRRDGIRSPDHFHGVAATGLMTPKVIRHIFSTLKPGVSEVMTHPGYADADLVKWKTRLLDSRAKERDILTSRDLRRLLDKHGIFITHFGEVTQ